MKFERKKKKQTVSKGTDINVRAQATEQGEPSERVKPKKKYQSLEDFAKTASQSGG